MGQFQFFDDAPTHHVEVGVLGRQGNSSPKSTSRKVQQVFNDLRHPGCAIRHATGEHTMPLSQGIITKQQRPGHCNGLQGRTKVMPHDPHEPFAKRRGFIETRFLQRDRRLIGERGQ
jgi:hypothetical protein